MNRHIADYFWQEGTPQPLKYIEQEAALSYKIVADPYNKHISIEKYIDGNFSAIIYDSAQLDFRHLRTQGQAAWERTLVREDCKEALYLLRDHNDRIKFLEICLFDRGICRQGLVCSPNGALLSRHTICYTALGDSFDGVELYDSNDHIVMRKLYKPMADEIAFGDILNEDWAVDKSNKRDYDKDNLS